MTTLPRLLLTLLLVPLLAAARPVHAAPQDLLAPGDWTLGTPHPGDASLETVPSATAGGAAVQRVTVKTASDPFYMIQMIRDIPGIVPEGHRIRMSFSARSETNNPLRATIERNGPPYTAAAFRMLTLTPNWQDYTLEGLAPGYGLNAHLQMGQQAGTIELRAITVIDEGVDPAIAEAQAALEPSRIQARIEKYRKGTLTIKVVDAQGKPVPGASVHIAQTRHAFLFGCNFFGLNPSDMSASQKAYESEFTALFNYATIPFYWGAFETKQGSPDYARLQTMASWSVAHGITVKGHPLVWHEVWPDWAPTAPDQAIPLLHARVLDLIPRYQNTIHYWDVLNEANAAADETPPNGESNWIKRDGPAPVVETALGWARAAQKTLPPSSTPETFLYNDFDTGEDNVALLTQLKKDGKLPDAIGIQSHMHEGEWPLTKVWSVCQTFAQFGPPIHFTETTVISGPRRDNPKDATLTDWNTTPEGETQQADYVTQFYTVLFSHPSLRAITWWDFSDRGSWQGAPAGLVRKDMSPKPAYTRLMKLIHKQWWTNVTEKANGNGTLTHRVFYGDYKVTVTDTRGLTITRLVTFPEASKPQTVTVRMAPAISL
ncbi:MAG: endo-1,4-beta-xylanase [Janthinobacterium lividum]